MRNYCLGKGYIKEISAVSNQYTLDANGYDFLEREHCPTNNPMAQTIQQDKKIHQKGTGADRKWKNEVVKYIIYPLLVILIGAIILKIIFV